MGDRGVFAVDRGIWSDPDFPPEPFSEREAFLWLVSEAAWRPTKVRVGARVIELERGQCAFSTRFMATRFRWSEARVRRFLGRRSSLNQICTKTDAGATQVTICKYDAFQRVGLPTDAEATQARRRSDAKKKQGNIETDISEADASSISDGRAGPSDREILRDFDETFWPAYPHKVGKGQARSAWLAARRKADLATLMDGLSRYVAGKPGDRAWRNPATWLNGECWADQPAPAGRSFTRTIDEHGNDDGSSDERGGGGYFAKEAALRRRQFAEREARSANEADRAGGADLSGWHEA